MTIQEASNKIWDAGKSLTHNQIDDILKDVVTEQKRLILEEVEKEKWKNDDGTPMTQEDSQVLGYDNNIISNLQDKIKKI